MMDKSKLLQQIIENLTNDLDLSMVAAQSAHKAAINDETQPDNKYDTLSLESSYIAQGYANRAQQLRKALEAYKKLKLRCFGVDISLGLTALVNIEYEDGEKRALFIGPDAGGMKITSDDAHDVVVITLDSPLCKALLGQHVGDVVSIGRSRDREFEIVSAC